MSFECFLWFWFQSVIILFFKKMILSWFLATWLEAWNIEWWPCLFDVSTPEIAYCFTSLMCFVEGAEELR